jgi:hypothetical protein
MVRHFRTLKFPNDELGIREKNRTLTQLTTEGWHIDSESIMSGHLKGTQACCLATICLPMGFLAGRTPGEIVVSLVREGSETNGALTAPGSGVAEMSQIPHQFSQASVAPSWSARVGRFCGQAIRRLMGR